MARVKQNWFYLLLPFALLAAWQVSLSSQTLANPVLTERVYLFDFGVFLPALYWLFLRGKVSSKAAALRALALAGAGLSFAAYLNPPATGEVLPLLSWLRWVALPVLVAIELAALIAITRYAYGANPEEERLIEQGMPPLLAKALLAEARFWKRVFAWLFGNKD
ncbi:hypothetical protein [Parerythrobacter jejuensis]|uniref:Uncharacterized protein n=1 Tax=Parerythrobacter jejuensis TaxID=795812 RepID=A0A845AQU1_9SPHN|nr:hypothetical protein [Parerythrobacter jejuensis]MXP32670.1 hypothetical protein [Parerythrobacter jejuensis]